MQAPPVQRINDLLTGLLDRGYSKQVTPILSALSNDPRLKSALSAFNTEAKQLADVGQPLTADNPALLNLRQTLDTVLTRQTARIDNAASQLQDQAVTAGQAAARQLALPGIADNHLAALGIQWNVPDPAAIARVVDYANSTAWANQLDQFGAGVADRIGKIAIAGIVDGQNPRAIARTVTQAVDAVPRYQAESLLRTLQLTVYRQSQAANYAANADIVEYVIRAEALDDRTCLACLALNGERYEVGDVIDEHPNGRAVAIPVVKGFERNVQSGEDWLNAQSEDRQRRIMGDANYNAWTDGAVQLSDFVSHGTDPLWGQVIEQQSLNGILGPQAKQYYQVNQKGK